MINYDMLSYALTLHSGESVFDIQPVEICHGFLDQLNVNDWNECHVYEWILRKTNNNYNIANIFKKEVIDGYCLLQINRFDYIELFRNKSTNIILWLEIKRLQALYPQ